MRKLRLVIRGPETTSFPIRSILFEKLCTSDPDGQKWPETGVFVFW